MVLFTGEGICMVGRENRKAILFREYFGYFKRHCQKQTMQNGIMKFIRGYFLSMWNLHTRMPVQSCSLQQRFTNFILHNKDLTPAHSLAVKQVLKCCRGRD